MREATAGCVRSAFCAEGMACARYRLYAASAEAEAFPSLARLFRAAALSKELQAAQKYRLAGELLDGRTVCCRTHFTLARTVDNLERSRDWEASEAKEAYEPWAAVARAQQEPAAVKAFKRSKAAASALANLMDRVFLQIKKDAGEPELFVYVCASCGLVMEGPALEECPTCGQERPGFTLVE